MYQFAKKLYNISPYLSLMLCFILYSMQLMYSAIYQTIEDSLIISAFLLLICLCCIQLNGIYIKYLQKNQKILLSHLLFVRF